MKILALAGGVGGAKLAQGLSRTVRPADTLAIVVNTGDDFSHLGLRICPDLDTVCYTLAGMANTVTGWGLTDETWSAMQELKRLGAPDWFNLGDRDLATHLERTRRLQEGQPLSTITRVFCEAWGIPDAIFPMSDDETPTFVHTDAGTLPFQEYFVHQHCEPRVSGFTFTRAEHAAPAPGVLDAIHAADIVIICPSNPWVSIGPMIAIPAIRAALQGKRIIAVSPIVGGQAIKGPAAKMYTELGIVPSALAVAEHYRGWISGMVIDDVDHDQAAGITAFGLPVKVAQTVMRTLEDREALAEVVRAFGEELSGA